MAHDLQIDPYLIFKLVGWDEKTNYQKAENISSGEIKKQYMKLSLQWHESKIRQREGRAPNSEEQIIWNDIQASYEILKDSNKKFIYDSYRKKTDNNGKFPCPNSCRNPDGSEKWINQIGSVISKKSLRYFCSGNCSRTWNTANGYTTNMHDYTPGGSNSGTNNNRNSRNNTPKPQRTCPGCNKRKNFSSHWWTRYSEFSSSHSQYCCSEYCLFSYLKSCGLNPKRCFKCGTVKKQQEANIWVRDPNTKNIFCSREHWQETGGSGLGTGGGPSNPPPNYTPPPSNDPLQAEKNTTISDIDNALLQDPEIDTSELESANQNWADDIKNATSSSQITAIKDRIVADINNKRQAKKNNSNSGGNSGNSTSLQLLQKARADAIILINSKLAESPTIESGELNNPNWENEITKAPDIDAVNRIRDEVLADIKNKRAAKTEETEIVDLLQQAKAATKYEELESILKEIKLLFSSNAYKNHEQEIKKQEARLQSLDPQKFKETTKKFIDEQLAQNGLRLEDFDQKTRNEIEEAINSGDQQKIGQVEEKIAIKGVEKKLDDILILAKKATTPEEKQKVIDELLKFVISTNDYQKKAYQNRKPAVDSMLAKLRGEEQTETPSKPLSPLIITILAVSLLGLIITSLLIVRRKRQQATKKIDKP